MKTTMKIFSLLVVLIMSGKLTSAAENPKVDMKAMAGKNAMLQIENDANTHLEILIQNKAGEVVYYKETEGDSAKYLHVYDFSEYKPGVYDLIVTANNMVTEHQFTIEDEQVDVGEKQMTQKPFFAFNTEDHIVRVAYLNYPGEKVKLKVYEGNELIYNKALDNSFSVNEGLNLSKLEAGRYQVVLAAGSKQFEYPVDIR
ncbi:hypothetical protein [Mangrovibacterium diazotrophicum]|uniref:Secreted protein (Por secretion system target) n=1 Tax=Mangrovibacterium diazotrophicum TaxID=1261403 RepID=A0A419W8T5_9BACT|nr:hypothetical protein [Mangrovibacterium diazotrophicum]RKD91887.1 hypothetical protein BC643_2256 [Mangrovibacterium diazotrophicum]